MFSACSVSLYLYDGQVLAYQSCNQGPKEMSWWAGSSGFPTGYPTTVMPHTFRNAPRDVPGGPLRGPSPSLLPWSCGRKQAHQLWMSSPLSHIQSSPQLVVSPPAPRQPPGLFSLSSLPSAAGHPGLCSSASRDYNGASYVGEYMSQDSLLQRCCPFIGTLPLPIRKQGREQNW